MVLTGAQADNGPQSHIVEKNSVVPEVLTGDSEERRKLSDSKHDLLSVLKPEVSKLCELLQLPVWQLTQRSSSFLSFQSFTYFCFSFNN